MEGFNYTDIFATKGLEYLIIISFLALLIPFSLVLNKKVRTTRQIKLALGTLSATMLKIPQGLYFARNHTWMFIEKTGIARVGLDDLLLHMTGEVRFGNLRHPGEMIFKGELLTELIHEGKTLQICSPVSGLIIQANAALDEQPGMLNDDPYGKGWMYAIKPTDWITEVKSCYFAEEATAWSAKELVRFKDFLTATLRTCSPDPGMVVLQDGGELCDHALHALPEDSWDDFQKEFLCLYRL
jgi:glycine cleavage system H protein